MKIKTMTGALMSAALVTGLVGCNARPVSAVDVDQSVMSPAAKALLPQDATITRVQEETYSDGNKNQVVYYSLNGQEKKIKINSDDETKPSGVFGVNLAEKEKVKE
jgi:hypothetical protein